jgi:hypothetical protein
LTQGGLRQHSNDDYRHLFHRDRARKYGEGAARAVVIVFPVLFCIAYFRMTQLSVMERNWVRYGVLFQRPARSR